MGRGTPEHDRLWRRRFTAGTRMGIGSHMPRTMEETHVTPARRSAYPQRVVDMSSGTDQFRLPRRERRSGPARQHHRHDRHHLRLLRRGRMRDSKDFPRSRPTPKSALWTPGPCRRRSSSGWSPSKRAPTSTATSATPSSSSTSRWSSSPPPGSAPAASRWRTSSRSAPSA